MKPFLAFVLIVLSFLTANLGAPVEDLQGSNTTVGANEPIDAERSGDATQSEPNVTVFAAKASDPSDLARLLAEVYKENTDVIVEALPVMKCVAVRADKNTTNEIGELLRRIERAVQNDGKPQIKIIPITPDRPGELLLRSGNNSATGRTQPAKLETGLIVQVLEFIKQGERIKSMRESPSFFLAHESATQRRRLSDLH